MLPKESDDFLMQNFSKDMKISSLNSYKSRINVIKSLAPTKSIAWIMKHPTLMLETLKNKFNLDNATLPNYITPITKLFSSNPYMIDKYKNHYQKWLIALREERDREVERYKKNHISEKQKNNIIDYKLVLRKYTELQKDIPNIFLDKKNNLEFLLLAILMNMRPKRADFGNVQIFHEIPSNKNTINYILLDKKPHFVLNNHKTSHVVHSIVEDINLDLQNIILLSLKYYPRKYLFVDSKGNPYEKNKSYAEFVKRVFLKYFGKGVGVSLWRRIYNYEKLDFNTMSWTELEHEAKLMGHSVMTQFLIYKIKK